MAKPEIMARHQPPGPVLLGQLQHEVHPWHGHHVFVKGRDNDLPDGEEGLHGFPPGLRRGQQRHPHAGDKFLWRAVEGKHGGDKSSFLRPLHSAAQQGLMAQMHAVEESQRDHFFCRLLQVYRPPY